MVIVGPREGIPNEDVPQRQQFQLKAISYLPAHKFSVAKSRGYHEASPLPKRRRHRHTKAERRVWWLFPPSKHYKSSEKAENDPDLGATRRQNARNDQIPG